MLTKQQITEILQENTPYLSAEYGVQRIGLFGSYANDTFNEASDIDIVIEFERPIGLRFVELTEYLEALLGKPVDVLTPAGIQSIRVGEVAHNIQETIEYV